MAKLNKAGKAAAAVKKVANKLAKPTIGKAERSVTKAGRRATIAVNKTPGVISKKTEKQMRGVKSGLKSLPEAARTRAINKASGQADKALAKSVKPAKPNSFNTPKTRLSSNMDKLNKLGK